MFEGFTVLYVYLFRISEAGRGQKLGIGGSCRRLKLPFRFHKPDVLWLR